MKNKILLSAGLFFSITSFAQQVQFGVSAGVTDYSIKGDAAKNLQQVLSFTNGTIAVKPVTGFYGGGYANIPLSGNFSVETGLYYSIKGYSLAGAYTFKGIDILSADATAKLHSAYIEIPLLLKGNFNGLQVFAGPQVAYLTNADINITAGLLGINLLNTKMNVTNQFNRWDVGAIAGVGYQFGNGLRITGSYERGLSKVDAGQNIKSYNQGFKIGAGFRF
jgi:hypothetical protein